MHFVGCALLVVNLFEPTLISKIDMPRDFIRMTLLWNVFMTLVLLLINRIKQTRLIKINPSFLSLMRSVD